MDWLRCEVERYAGKPLEPYRELPAWEHRDYLGWHEQGDGRLFIGLGVENGRIKDDEQSQPRSALRRIVARFDLDLVLTPQQNVFIIDIPRDAREPIVAILAEHGVRPVETISLLERRLRELGLEREPISIRMTGCPNGCARSYMSEVGIVGVSADRYNVYLGGETDSTRLQPDLPRPRPRR